MNCNLRLQVGLIIMMLGLTTQRALAQCNPPGSFWSTFPQSATTLTLNWVPPVGASQYQVRFWRTAAPDDKTIVDNVTQVPYTVVGLRKYTEYSFQVRSRCGSNLSDWSNTIEYTTAFNSTSCTTPLNATATVSGAKVTVNWLSPGSHTLRYRVGITGDWLVPAGAMSVSSTYTISGLAPGTYQIELKRNCSSTSSNFVRFTRTIQPACGTPLAPAVVPDITRASVLLPVATDVVGYNMEYRKLNTGNWISVGNNILPSTADLNPPLSPSTQYEVHIQAVCTTSTSPYSPSTAFTTSAPSSCLINKNYGKNMNAGQKTQVDGDYNKPSAYTFGSMIGVNDGGLFFRSFQNVSYNQITQLTRYLRRFHTIDEDFNPYVGYYDENIKPKNTIPEGTPGFTARNRALYDLYKNTHGFNKIVAPIELLQYSPLSWKDKIYKESDWSMAGYSGIRNSFENYVKKFIDVFAPANGGPSQQLVSVFQVGNELWDYPEESDYHSLLTGTRNAFINKYGPKSAGGWKMDFAVSAFQAFRNSTCIESLRDVSNCGGGLERHDFIGDYLNVMDCDILKDLDIIDCHPYSFIPGTTNWTYPENPQSETAQIRNLAAWRDANRNYASGVLAKTRLWSSEFGFDSDARTGVGEKTQSAYLLRGLLMHGRYHYEKVFFYNAFDHARTDDPNYEGLYSSSGFWRLGTEPANSAWPSPLEQHGATPKPSWFGMMDMKSRFGEHVFYKALLEDQDAYVYLLAKPDGSDPYIVMWSPKHTNDANINDNIAINKVINWSAALPGEYSMATLTAQTFAENAAPGQSFAVSSGSDCGTATLTNIRRNPSFIRLADCSSACPNVYSFKRVAHSAPGCNANGDHYYEVALQNVTVNDEITITGLPNSGINPILCTLNGIPFNGNTFQSSLQFVNENTFRWLVNTGNGSIQTLRLFYCWANTYPPISSAAATSLCSGSSTPCVAGTNITEPGMEDRGSISPDDDGRFSFTVQPNPGRDQIELTYSGPPAAQANLQIVSSTNQKILTRYLVNIKDGDKWQIDARNLPSGLYFLYLQTNREMQHRKWEKY